MWWVAGVVVALSAQLTVVCYVQTLTVVLTDELLVTASLCWRAGACGVR